VCWKIKKLHNRYIYIKRVLNIYDFEALKKKENKTKQASARESDSDSDYFTDSDIDSD